MERKVQLRSGKSQTACTVNFIHLSLLTFSRVDDGIAAEMLVRNIVTHILFFLFIKLQEKILIGIVCKTLDTKITSLGAVIFYESPKLLIEFVAFLFHIRA